MRAAAHARHVGKDLNPFHRRAHVKRRSQPDMPVLRDHNTGRRAMTDQHTAMKRRIHHVADDHAVPGRLDRLDPAGYVHPRVQPDSARRARPQRRAVAVPPLAAEAEAVRRPRRQRKLKNVRGVGDRRRCRRRR